MQIANAQSGPLLGPSSRLGRYEILAQLAEGGMATVWAARPIEAHGSARLVVLKTIRPEFAGDERFRELFLREGGIASRITHRSVARIFDLGEEACVLFIAMEYIDGPALSHLRRACRTKGMDIPAAILLRIAAEACAGLHAAHELRDGTGKLLNVVHRDISPSNILISGKGIAKIIDFGVAKTEFGLTRDADSERVGKMAYMAPEQALGLAVDRRADVWALGAILYHALSGTKPYEAPNWRARLQVLASGQAPSPLPPRVHPVVAAMVSKALSFAPVDRYRTTNDLRQAIEEAMVAARLTATIADVAAFSKQNAPEDAQRREIEATLASATERDLAGSPIPRTGQHQESRATVAPEDGSTPRDAAIRFVPSEHGGTKPGPPGLFDAVRRWWRSS